MPRTTIRKRQSQLDPVTSALPFRETLRCWRQLAFDVTEKRIAIRMWREPVGWRLLVPGVTGLTHRHIMGAVTVLKNGRYTIHLRISGRLEYHFRKFVHELGHIALNHFKDNHRSILQKEVEADAWGIVNFREEINTVKRYLGWEIHGKEAKLGQWAKRPSSKLMERVIDEVGTSFILNPEVKVGLWPWLSEMESIIQTHIRLRKKWDELARRRASQKKYAGRAISYLGDN